MCYYSKNFFERFAKLNLDGMVHYEEPKPKEEKLQPSWWYYQARSTDIEQTAYALLAILQKKGKEGIADAVQIVRWLSKQRNGLGGWSSTQVNNLAEAAAEGVLWKMLFLKISQYSHANTCVRV